MIILGDLAIGVVGAVVLVTLLYLLFIDIQYRRRPGNALELTAGVWRLDVYEPQRYLLVGELEFHNLTRRLEIMVPEASVEVTLLSSETLDGTSTSWIINSEELQMRGSCGCPDGVSAKTRIFSRGSDAIKRLDGYWEGHIVKVGKSDPVEVLIEIRGEDLSNLTVAWIKLRYITYGPEGQIPKVRHVVVPLKFPTSESSTNWRAAANAQVLPVRTHLLTMLDTPLEVVRRYVLPHAQPGDVVAIGESPVAIMQGRFRHPTDVKPGWVAKRLCYLFLPTSSLATACGLQALVDIVGPVRVLAAFFVGAVAKLLGKPGVFYQLAGEQARLIDDVTGTIPPYDKFIVLGPKHPQKVVDEIQRETGVAAAIVDVNDLGAVKILAASRDVKLSLLKKALVKNPAGNANEQTPIVLIRPSTAVNS